MFFTYNRPLILIFWIGILLLLAGCSGKQKSYPQPDSAIASDSTELDGTVPLPDEELCPTDELQLLRNSGTWHIAQDEIEIAPAAEVEYDFPVVVTPQVEMYIKLFQTKQKRQITRWLERSTKYKSMMEKELEAAGLPKDLVYLSMIESGYMQTARSKAKAVGLWQFMKPTGKGMGLVINRHVDERRNAIKSTKAASRYLKQLYEQFGDWHLAVAAYNAGPGKVRYGLKKYKVDNFWDLADKKHLRLETKRYVPKLIATILVARDPEKYGFTDLNYQTPLEYETVEVDGGLPLSAVAAIAETETKVIEELNRELYASRVPHTTKKYTVNIPHGTKETVEKNLPRLHSIVSTGFKIHIVRRNESMRGICRRYNINSATVKSVNNLKSNNLAIGKRLKIPYSTVRYTILPKGDNQKLLAYKNNLILHKIKKGETISKIARKYRVPAELIVSWNELPSVHKIRAGQQLALYIDRGATTIAPSKAKKKNHTVATLSHTTKKTTRAPRYYRVKNGDSLWTIAKKFGTSTKVLKQLNNLQSNIIRKGEHLMVKEG